MSIFPLRVSATAALILSLALPVATPSFSQTDQAEEAKHRVNLAGRQRMLSQRMSMAACFIYVGVERDNMQIFFSKLTRFLPRPIRLCVMEMKSLALVKK